MRKLTLALTLSACGGGGEGGGGGCGAGGGNKLVYTDEHNYTYSGTLTLERIDVAPGADLTITWNELTTDIRGRPVTTTAIDQTTIVGMDGNYDEVRPKAERNEIRQDNTPYIYYVENDGAEQAQLSSFELTNIAIDLGYLVPDDETTWFLSLMNRPQERYDILSTVHIVPTEGEQNTEVSFKDDSAALDFEADLHSAPRLQARAGKAYTFDWREATKDVFGNPFNVQLADELLIVRHDKSIEEIELDFLQLDIDAAEIYRASVGGLASYELWSATHTTTQQPFQGFTTEGTWLVGVLCSNCSAPVPVILAVVEVE